MHMYLSQSIHLQNIAISISEKRTLTLVTYTTATLLQFYNANL